jgi:transmembrane sensor
MADPLQQTAGQLPAAVTSKGKVQLVLADGRTVSLDGENKMVQKGIVLQNGELHYTHTNDLDTGYNTVAVPAGQQMKIVLDDGSVVWLNAETAIRFAINFDQHPRKVSLSGEAFFDVRHNPSKPFVVTSNGQDVTVLGTEFNVKAYETERITTTLVKGSVRVEANGKTQVLKPGEQSITGDTDIAVQRVAVEESTAWKEGLFLFRSAPIETVAAQLKQWYGVEVAYEGKPSQHFNATIRRSESLERVLQVLEGSGYVHFRLKGNQLLIKP